MYKRSKSRQKRLFVLISLILCITIILSFTFYKMHPVIMRYAVSCAETLMLNSANKAIVNVLEKNNVGYDDIVILTSNEDGYVTSLEINVNEINVLKSQISNELSEIIEKEERYDIGIPIGTFLGNTYTAGFGPDIKFKMQLTSTAFVDFAHEFKSAGINQVLHIVTVKIDIKGSLVIANYSKAISASTSAIAAQTVIVGKTPEAFTSVIESETDNTGGLLNDYGAGNVN